MTCKTISTDYSPCYIAVTGRGRNIPMGEYLCTVYNKNTRKTLTKFP